MENIQELMNSLQGFIEEQQQLEDGDPGLSNFLKILHSLQIPRIKTMIRTKYLNDSLFKRFGIPSGIL
jgi:hypothetical protein